jgi:N-dimethylarginine dimethylaminohydrolase
VNGRVIAAAAHRETVDLIRSLGFDVRPVDLTEFAKAEGGVTCLSVLLETNWVRKKNGTADNADNRG